MRVVIFISICLFGISIPSFSFAQQVTEQEQQNYLEALEQMQQNQVNDPQNRQQLPSTFSEQGDQRSLQQNSRQVPQQPNNSQQLDEVEQFDLEAELGEGKDIDDFMIDNPNEPETQEEINTLIDNYLRAQFGDIVYTESTSIGELKMMIRQPVLHTNENIQFIIIPQHIDESLDFEKADYTWKVRKGDEILKTVQDQGKLMFYFDFYNPGKYQVEAEVEFGDETKTSLMTFDVYDPLELSFTPETPGKGDAITVKADHNFVSDTQFQWTVDGTVVEQKKDQITFQEFKGYGRTYDIMVKAQGKDGTLQSLGKKKIRIQEPEIEFSVIDMNRNEPINFISQTRIDEPTSLRIRPKISHFPEDSYFNYYYRVNGKMVQDDNEILNFDIDPEHKYTIDLVVVDELTKVSARKSFTVNPDQNKDTQVALAAQISETGEQQSSNNIPGRYINLVILGLIGVLSFFLTRYGKLK